MAYALSNLFEVLT